MAMLQAKSASSTGIKAKDISFFTVTSKISTIFRNNSALHLKKSRFSLKI
jgi:hypothetical protein